MIEHIQLKIKRNVLSTSQSGATIYVPMPTESGVFKREYQASDGNVYTISRDQVVTVPHFVGVEWLATDPDLEQVSRS